MGKKSKKKLLKQKNAFLKKENLLLNKAVRQTESAMRTKNIFFSHMSHDMRTCINSISGMTSIAMKNSDDKDKMLDCLIKVDDASRYLITLVNDLLDMSRIENGKMTTSSKPIDIRNVIEQCALITDGLVVQRKVEFIRGFDDFKHPLLIGDETHLGQVFLNILGNSVKFTLDGGKIYFNVKEISSGDDKATYRFEIKDTGIGMEKSFLDKIWEPFIQEKSRHHNGYKGTGLGMAITKRLVDLMGGTISVESKPGSGSKFTIEITFDINPDAQETKALRQPSVNLAGMKVLLVEDHEINMEIAKTILETRGIDVMTAKNGQIAVDIFSRSKENRFDAILMDVRMPVMDGPSATKAIRKLHRKDAVTVPIIAFTADAYEEDIRKFEEAGMNAHLTKPIQQERLFQTLGRFYADSPAHVTV